MAATPLASARPVAPRGVPAHAPAAAIIGGGRRAPARGFRPPSRRRLAPPSRAATSSRAPAPTPPAAAAAAGSAGASSRPTTPYPLASGGEGWNAVELYALTGLVWRFTTPSSTDGRKIVKAAAERAGVSLKGSSNFRKEDWNDAAEEASIARLDTFSTLPGMRGFRACWADHGVALLYVPGVRRFYTVADVANGAADRKAEMDAASVISNIEGLFKSKPGLREQYEIATDPARAAEAAKAHLAELAKDFESRGGGGDGVESSDAGGSPASSSASLASSYPDPQCAIAKWCVGAGVDAATLWAEFSVGFDFHGPAGLVSRSVIAAAASAVGRALEPDVLTDWAKSEWVEAMAELGVTYRATHAPLASLGRSWKVCWIEDAASRGSPGVVVWCPERNAYFTLGSLAAAGSSAPAPVEAAIRAIVGVAKSTPAPQGLKNALTKDADFLTLLGRKPAEGFPVAAGTTGGVKAARLADEAWLKSNNTPPVNTTEKSRVEANDRAGSSEDAASVGETAAPTDGGVVSSDDASASTFADRPPSNVDSVPGDGDSDDDDSYFRAPPPLDDFEWADSREGLRRRPTRADSDFDSDSGFAADDAAGGFGWDPRDAGPASAPGFEDVPGMEGFVADDRVTGQGEFFSRSAGYLSFVDGSWTKEDLARELGMERHPDEPPVTPRDFPDLSLGSGSGGGEIADPLDALGGNVRRADRAGEAALSAAVDAGELRELVPRGLPRAFEQYYPLRLRSGDYLVATTNDGRLDVREMMYAARREGDGAFVGEAVRVDTSAFADRAPAFYHEVAWTEREVRKEESPNPDGGPTSYDTLEERTTRVFLVRAETPFDDRNAFDRKLDFTEAVVALDDHGRCERRDVAGAAEHPGGVLVIREGEMFVEAAEELPNWEQVAHEWEVDRATAAKEKQGPALHEDFLKEVEDNYIPDDTPEVDNF